MFINISVLSSHVFAMSLFNRLLFCFVQASMDDWFMNNFKKTGRPQTLILDGDAGTGDERRRSAHLSVTLSESLAFSRIGKIKIKQNKMIRFFLFCITHRHKPEESNFQIMHGKFQEMEKILSYSIDRKLIHRFSSSLKEFHYSIQ